MDALAELVDGLYPPVCWLCGTPTGGPDTCGEHRLPARPPGPRCGRCQARLAAAFSDGDTCSTCRAQPPRFGRVLALGDYRQAELRAWILAFKHGGRPDLARPLASALLGRARRAGWSADLARAGSGAWLVPVPLHPLRRMERGYDQALLLARALAEGLETRSRPLLRRCRFTEPQGDPGSRARHLNVRAAFALEPDLAGRVAGRDFILVDDVLTSGATAEEGARTLRRAGARRVDVLVLACARGDA
ncbi:MAG: ComF family protein [Chlamydiales bacterium]